jgi:hypothetical protein
VLEDRWGARPWEEEWRALPRRQRAALLTELRRGEILRPPADAHLAVRAAQQLLPRMPLQALIAVLVPLVAIVLFSLALDPLPLFEGLAELRFTNWSAWLFLAAVVAERHRRDRRALRAGVERNLDGLRHWVEHGRPADLGPPTGREAALLLKLIEEEGWTRPHR